MNHITRDNRIEWLVVANIERSRIAAASLKFATYQPTDLVPSLTRSRLFSESVQSYAVATCVLSELNHG